MGSHHKKYIFYFINVWILPKMLPKLRLPKVVQLATLGICLLTVMSKHLVEIYVYIWEFWQ